MRTRIADDFGAIRERMGQIQQARQAPNGDVHAPAARFRMRVSQTRPPPPARVTDGQQLVLEALRAVYQRHGKTAARAILRRHGAERVVDLDPRHFGTVIDEARRVADGEVNP